MQNTSKKTVSNKTHSYKKIVWLSILASFLLLVTNSAVWVNRQIFNAENFTQVVTESISSESSRNAIAQNITDRIFVDKPIAKRIAGDFSVKIIGGLLDTNQFNTVLSTTVERMQVYVTSNNQEDVTVELGAVKDVLTRITAISESLGNDVSVNAENIPEQITLIEEKDVPDLYSASVVMLWLAPISFVTALILFVYPYAKRLNDKRRILLIQGAIITIVSLAGYLIGPLFRPPVLAQVKLESRTVVSNLYDAFIATFNNQTLYMTLFGILLVLIATTWLGYPRFKKALVKQEK